MTLYYGNGETGIRRVVGVCEFDKPRQTTTDSEGQQASEGDHF